MEGMVGDKELWGGIFWREVVKYNKQYVWGELDGGNGWRKPNENLGDYQNANAVSELDTKLSHQNQNCSSNTGSAFEAVFSSVFQKIWRQNLGIQKY